VTFDEAGNSLAVTFGMVMSAAAVAIFATGGFGNATVIAEETKGARRSVARAVLWALGITVAVELIPVTAALLGAPSLKDLVAAPTPMSYILTSLGGETVNTIVSLLVFVAIVNGILAIVIIFSRALFGSGRDRVWPEPISRWLALVHPRYKSPWVAALVVAVVGAVLTGASSVAALVTFNGVVLVSIYFLISISALVVRLQKRDLPAHYTMPLWPVWPILSLAGMGYVFKQQSGRDLLIVLGITVVSLVYYYAYLRPRAATHYLVLEACEETAADLGVDELKAGIPSQPAVDAAE